MSTNQNITSGHRSPNRERNGYVFPVTSLQKEKPASFFCSSFRKRPKLYITFFGLIIILFHAGCTTEFVTSRKAIYATSKTSTLFLLEESGRHYFLPVTGEGFFPAFDFTDFMLVKKPINDQVSKQILEAPNDFHFPFSKLNDSGTITIYDRLKRIVVSRKTDAHPDKVKTVTYNSIRQLPYMDKMAMELYSKAKDMSNEQLLYHINSEENIGGISNRNIILSYLVNAHLISSKYRKQTIGLYFNDACAMNPNVPLDFVEITDFDQELVDKIKKYSVIVSNYDYLQ